MNLEVPRFPGPKFEWHQWFETALTGQFPIGGSALTTTLFDYWIESIDVYAAVSGLSNEEFHIGFVPTSPPGAPIEVFFGGQISPNTGLYFPWRGLIQWHPNSSLTLENVNGNWSVYVSGFFTSSEAAQP